MRNKDKQKLCEKIIKVEQDSSLTELEKEYKIEELIQKYDLSLEDILSLDEIILPKLQNIYKD
jgi:hypothetical protein